MAMRRKRVLHLVMCGIATFHQTRLACGPTASFVTGSNVAVAMTGGTPTSFHGQTGSFTVAASNKAGRDLRGKGRLQYVGQHHLKFADGEWFLKAGLDR
jgi:hypothetical protein